MLLWEYGALRRRPRIALHLLCAAWMGMLALSPALLTSMSFQLTFGAVLGLGMVMPWLQGLWQPAHHITARLWDGLCAAVGAQVLRTDQCGCITVRAGEDGPRALTLLRGNDDGT